MKKDRKSDSHERPSEAADTSVATDEQTYEEKLAFVSVIAKPMATKKLTKKLYKLIRKASKHKTYTRVGLKNVQTRLRKGEKGIVIFAGNVTPIEVMCHLPGVCEDKSIPYIYTPSRQDLGLAMGIRRGGVAVLVREHADYKEQFNECVESINELPPVF